MRSPANYEAVKKWLNSKIIWSLFGSAHVWIKLTRYSFLTRVQSMKIYCIEKHLRGIIIYILPLLIGVTELRSVHVHMINLSNKGEMVQFNPEITIVLNPKKHLTLNRILCFCFNLHFLPLFLTTFNPFLPDLHPLSLSK